MDDSKDNGQVPPTPRQKGDMGDVLRAQGFSQNEISEIQQHLDNEDLGSAELAQLPMPILQQYARSLAIDGVNGLPKDDLVTAIRDASN